MEILVHSFYGCYFEVEREGRCDVTPYGQRWMIGHAPVREWAAALSSAAEVWLKRLRRSETTAEGSAQSVLGLQFLLLLLWQSFLVKMAYHSPYRAPPQINAPPDQSFLWNIFQRWVRGDAARFRRLPLSLSLSLRSAVSSRCCRKRREEEERRTGWWFRQIISVTVRFFFVLSFFFFPSCRFCCFWVHSKGPRGNSWPSGGNTTAVCLFVSCIARGCDSSLSWSQHRRF